MGFFDLFKKNITCARCNATISASDAKTLNGKQYCPNCYRRLQQAAQSSQGSSQGRQNSGAPNNRSFEDKYGDKYGKSSGSGSSTGSSSGGSSGYSGKSTGSTGGCPATIADIKRVLDETSTKYREENNGKQWEIITGFTGKDKNYLIKFISTGSDDDALAIRVFAIASAESSQYRRIYPVLNKIQEDYRYLRFTLDRDGDINVEYDVTGCGKDAGLVALEMIVRITKILDEVYPQIKRAVYS